MLYVYDYFRFGRKRSLLYGSIPLLGGWIIVALAESFELLCVFCFLSGLTIGGSYVVLPMYIADISSAHIRGYLGTVQTVMAKVGLLFMYAVGPFISIRLMAWICTIPVIIFIAIYYWLPESPYYLLASDQPAKAEVCLQKLRCNLDVNEELTQMKVSVIKSKANRGTYRELFFNPRNRRSMIVVLGISVLFELSGSQIVLQYAQTIFDTLQTDLDSRISSIIFGIAQLVAAIVSCFLVDTMGRRPLLLVSIVGSGICTLVIGVYYVLERHMDVSGLGWLPVSAIMIFMLTYTVGILALLTVITSELFPNNLKSIAGSTMVVSTALVGLVLLSVYQYAVDVWGSDYVFIAFSLCTFAFIPFVLFIVPETKRKSLDSILQEETLQTDEK